MGEPTDIELMRRVADGNVDAFRLLTLRYREPLRRFFYALLADRSQAEDYVQETFLRLWFSRERYTPTGKFSTYLFQIGKHYWFNQRKKFQPTTVSPEEPALQILSAAPETEPETMILKQWRQERVVRAIRALPEHYRCVFTLSHLQGQSYAEIATRLSLPLGTVKSRMAEATRRLRQMLTEDDRNPE